MKLPFLFGIHCHQPVDNFHSVLDEAIEKSYRPFLETISEFPEFKCAVHFSGWLLEYIRENDQSLFSLMQRLGKSGQLEFFTGGFYEPVLAAIPSHDRVGQIQQLSDYIQTYFEQMPKGLWLTERVWDPAIVPDIAACGVEYVIVDDYHFMASGYDKDSLYGYYLTEQDGISLKIFPIDQQLRYLTPFKPMDQVSDYLSDIQDKSGKMAVVFDDGEKFGIWPETYEWVYEKEWLKKFLTAICDSDAVESMHFGDAVTAVPPNGLAYLPITSYMEMGEWSLFSNKVEEIEDLQTHLNDTHLADLTQTYVKGGIWKNFFAKYPESNWIHKRCVALSKKAKELNDKEINDALYRAECNDVLWHGIFGGLYLPNLRNNAYRYIIRTSAMLDTALKVTYPAIDILDIDFDGYDDVSMKTDRFEAWFTSRDGGQLVEFGCKQTEVNLLNTLSRRREGYHRHLLNPKPVDEAPTEGVSTIHNQGAELDEDVKKLLVHDWYNRNSFIDHVVLSFDAASFADMTVEEMGDFVNQPVKIEQVGQSVIFTREGGVYFEGEKYRTALKKVFSIEAGMLVFDITLETTCPSELTYVMETNWHIYDVEQLKINQCLVSEQSVFNDTTFTVVDGTMPVSFEIEMNKALPMFTFPVQTVSQSEKGVDLTTQGICMLMPVAGVGRFQIAGKVKLK